MAAKELEHIDRADVAALLEREQDSSTYGVIEVHLQAGQITRVHVHRTEIIRAKPAPTPAPSAGRSRTP